MTQLGKALGILVQANFKCRNYPYYAMSPDHAQRMVGRALRFHHRRACHVAGVRNMRLLRRAMLKAMGNDAWVYRHFGHVPY